MNVAQSFEANNFEVEVLPTPGVPVIAIILLLILAHLLDR